MGDELFKTPSYLRRYFAGQALIGLLAEGKLRPADADGAKKLAKLAYMIGDAMVAVGNEGDFRPKSGSA